jgi:hypothetical protein
MYAPVSLSFRYVVDVEVDEAALLFDEVVVAHDVAAVAAVVVVV